VCKYGRCNILAADQFLKGKIKDLSDALNGDQGEPNDEDDLHRQVIDFYRHLTATRRLQKAIDAKTGSNLKPTIITYINDPND